MTSFEDSIESRMTLTKGHADPPPTDLDYYSRPENYTGGALSLQQFMFAARKLTSSRDKINSEKSDQSQPDASDATLATPADDVVRENGEDEKFTPGSRPQSRRSSVQISSRRGSIHLEFKPRRKLSSGAIKRPNFERTRKLSATDSQIFGRTAIDSQVFSPGVVDGDVPRKISSGSETQRSRRQSVDERKEKTLTIKARNRFRHAVNIVLILRKWISTLTEKEEAEDTKSAGRTFTDIASEAFASDEQTNSSLTFDPSLFKANREINISNEVKSILSIPSSTRTPDQLQTALYGLQHLKSFAEYPLHMQEKLCKVAWFQLVPPKRVIIRQGHYAENFYFILSGQALVRILERNPKTGEAQLRTATIMRKGTSFGELALLHHSRRTATVVSQDSVQLLSIGREDFFDIFMGGDSPGEIPDHIKFCSTLDFMKDWPIDKLLEHPERCLFHFFKRGVVIVKDSNNSEWLYIVKSGSCQVVKQLKGVTPGKHGRAKSARQRHSPRAGNQLTVDKVNCGAKVDTGLRRPHSIACMEGAPSALQEARERFLGGSVNHENTVASVQPLDSTSTETASLKDTPGFSFSKFKTFTKTQKAHFTPAQRDPTSVRTTAPGEWTRNSTPTTSDRRDNQFVDEVSLKGPVFVKVEVLKPKDVFGLTTIKFDDDVSVRRTSVSLVSNGAECIMFSKKFFTDHANELVRKMIRHQVRHYPTEDNLQRNLQSKVDWDLYKKRLIRDTMEINKFRGLFV